MKGGVFVFFLSQVVLASVSSLWWNLGQGNVEFQQLNSSLETLIDKDYDILMFGEVSKKVMLLEAWQEIENLYPYQHGISYSQNSDTKGIIVFSRYPLVLRYWTYLDWVPKDRDFLEVEEIRNDWLENHIASRNFDRPFFIFEIEKEGQKYQFSPIHILNPWRRYFGADGANKKEALGIVYRLLLDKQNPLYWQIEDLTSVLKEYFWEYPEICYFVMGDFNYPRLVFGVETEANNKLNQILEDHNMNGPASFPEFGLQIDQIYTYEARPSRARSLRLKGSDHLPIQAQISCR